MSTPTSEFRKQAAAAVPGKKQGFITHMKAAGVSDAKVTELIGEYDRLDTHRTNKIADMREAILGHA